MNRLGLTIGLLAVASVFAAACGRSAEQAPAQEGAPAAAPAPPPESATQQLDITFKSDPESPKIGENTFETMVMAGSQPVTDAEVSVQLYMPAMPAMKMPEMKNSVPLKHEGGGRYSGTGNVMMAGTWDATVMVMRGGQEVGTRKFTVTAK